MTALVLAGGLGRRLQPYTLVLPKPLLPLEGEPLLALSLRRLKAEGFDRVVLAAGRLEALMRACLGDGGRYGVELLYLPEPRPLGTFGPVRLLDGGKPILVLNGDLLTLVPFADVLAFHVRAGADLTVVARAERDPAPWGVVEARDGRVRSIVEKPARAGLMSAGIYALDPGVLAGWPRGEPVDAPAVITGFAAGGRHVACYVTDAYWRDVGTPAAFRAARRDCRRVPALRRLLSAAAGDQSR